MELIRQWALTLCICAIITSILQGILPEKGAFSGIKLVLTLYILITLLSPLKSFSISQIDLRVDTPEVAVLQQDTEQVILNRAQNQLSEKVKKALESEGVEAISVDLTLKLQQDGGVVVDAVEILVAQKTQDSEKVRRTVTETLGCDVEVDVSAAEETDEG